jgi:hypothetical protein
MLRLRQIAFVAKELEPVVDDLSAVLGLAVAYRDPGVATFGLHNAVMPAGQQFIEVVAPVQENTAGGRYLERRHGDGGYMVIMQCDDHPTLKARLTPLGVRAALEHDGAEYCILQLHPRDTGGSFLEIDVQHGGESMDGPWEPAGPNWHDARTDTTLGIVAAELQSEDPAALSARWSAILDRPVDTVDGVTTIALDNATLRFVDATDGRGEGLGGIDVAVADVNAAVAAATARGLVRNGEVSIGGVRIALCPA